jgi:lipoprotein NlpI
MLSMNTGSIRRRFWLTLLSSVVPGVVLAQADSSALLEQAAQAFAKRDFEQTVALTTRALDGGGPPDSAYALRAAAYSELDKSKEAIADLDQLIQLRPTQTSLLEMRGTEKFKLHMFDAAIADFDRECKLDPRREPWHWKRGLAYYYAGQYEKGRDQFQKYHDQEDNDVENAVWRVMCMAGMGDVGLEEAQRQVLLVRRDSRVPMMEAYRLFAGKGTMDDVLSAIKRGDPDKEELNRRMFYGHLYLGLYLDMVGRRAEAKGHLAIAVKHRINHFMWDIAKLHLAILEKDKSTRGVRVN